MWWLIHKLKKNNQQRINQIKCRRCGLLYLKVLDNCPHCSGVVIPPLITEVKSRGYATFNNCLGGIPPIDECGRSLLYVQSHWVASN